MKVSNRVWNIEASPMRKLNPIVRELIQQGIKVYQLNIGQPDIKTPNAFLNAIQDFSDEIISYTPSEGIPELIKSIQNYYKMYNIHFNEDEILVTNGGSEALLYAFMGVCDIGDQVLIPEPFYSNYNTFAKLAGAEIVAIPTKIEDDFALPSFEKLDALINKKVKAILLTHPGNPTGKVYNQEEMQRIAKLALKHDLFIIADEVYREFVYDGISYNSFASREEIKDRVIIIDSVSKRYSACGARIGCISSKNKQLMKQLLKVCQSRLSVPILEQIGATALFSTPKEYFYEIIEIYRKRRDIVYQSLKQMEGVICGKPQGAFYIIAKLPIDDCDTFAKWMLEKFRINNETLLLAPAKSFYSTQGMGNDEMRIAYILEEESLKRAMYILQEALKKYPGRKY
ncbi:pyridoxal phosphate-dependent aminotransferase [Garciella nitratireducens]|uniref:pyridoxal phosphate-dependent aminotransferase n=1 Tax=Garciella nitratireducens TaxID=218205 RepID=UPI001BD40FE9|nr:pyridoxal phosphate-dependent aminotransferase [Garciella nitratireducens]